LKVHIEICIFIRIYSSAWDILQVRIKPLRGDTDDGLGISGIQHKKRKK